MVARQAVIDAVSGDVIVIMDVHMEVAEGKSRSYGGQAGRNDTESGVDIVIMYAHMEVAEGKSRSYGG